ncbi:MAG: alpha/beta hydrolase [Clostridia bacterium]|nr:alpha/beta hydrolase [Clostridia bacterium]
MIYSFEGVDVNYQLVNFNKKTKQKGLLPIVFLHGWSCSLKHFMFCAKNLKNHPCVLIDFPPFGKSKPLLSVWSVKDYTRLVINLCLHLNILKANFVAHSFGGRVAIELASKTSIVNKMILTSSAGINKRRLKIKIKEIFFKFKKFLFKLKLYPQSKLQKAGSEDYKKLSPLMKQTFVKIVNYNQTNLLNKIIAPTLLFWGKQDKETPFYFTKIFKKHIKDCEVISFNNLGHFAYMQKPSTFIKVIDYFFKD